MSERVDRLTPGMRILYGGNHATEVSAELAAAFKPGDRLVVVQTTGDLLHVPASVQAIADESIARAQTAFLQLGGVADWAISAFYEAFARRLEDDAAWAAVVEANAADVAAAKERGRSTTRLAASEKMRADMVAGLRGWRDAAPVRGRVLEAIDHGSWSVEQIAAGLGVVAFVFEGRPNVFADATGVLRGGNAVVFRIGSDALGTARAMMRHALTPALAEAGLPEGTVGLVDSAERAAGWAMFSNPGVALAVARGSGAAVAQLGAVARQTGIPASLHGTGGAWIICAEDADAAWVEAAVFHSLDRKVCNSLNVFAVVRSRAADLAPVFLDALTRAGQRRAGCKLHVAEGSESWVPDSWFRTTVSVRRAEGDAQEPLAELLPRDQLGIEWEWEESPEATFLVVDSVDEAIRLFNEQSPRLAASLISANPAAHAAFAAGIDAPFYGNGMTRWVDGQFALNRPELGLSNWQAGRLFARGGVLSGDSVYTVRTRAWMKGPDVHR